MKTYEHSGTTGNNICLRRLGALIIDAVISLMAAYIFYALPIIASDKSGLADIGAFFSDASFVYLSLFFFKDVFGRSLGKVIFGLYIVDAGTNQRADVSKRFFRNFSLMIFPVEALAVLISESNTRIADKLFEAEVVSKI